MIVAAIPAYNEAKYIADVVKEAKEYVDVVLVLDDGSTDGTAMLAQSAGAYVADSRVNLGYGATVRDLLAVVAHIYPDAIMVLLDADSQHYPSDIPKVVAPIAEGYDIVNGRRRNGDVPLYRLVGGTFLSLITRGVARVPIRDTQSGFRAFSPKAVKLLAAELKEDGMTVGSEAIIKGARAGLRMTEVPISVRYTEDGSTHHPVAQGLRTLWGVIVLAWKPRRWV